jgi:hypothetical protein
MKSPQERKKLQQEQIERNKKKKIDVPTVPIDNVSAPVPVEEHLQLNEYPNEQPPFPELNTAGSSMVTTSVKESSTRDTIPSNMIPATERKPRGAQVPTTEWTKHNQVLSREGDLPLLAAYIGPFSVDEILQGVLAYVLTANAAEAERLTGIHESTIRHWKRAQPWWDEAVAYCKRVKQDELDARFTSIIHKAADRLAKRVDADELTARELVQVTSVIFKDRNLLRGDPTNITKKEENVEGKMADLMQKFEQMSDKINAKVIEGETVDGS